MDIPPFRSEFDAARDPLTARTRLGAATNPVPTAQIADGAITTAKIADGAVTDVKLALTLAWTSYTPTVTAFSGTFTSVSATGKFLTIGKVTFVQINITVTTNGSAAGVVIATLPNTAASNNVLAGREAATTGKMLQGMVIATATSVRIANYDNTYPAADGYLLVVSGSYENT